MATLLLGDVGGSSSRWALVGDGEPRLLHAAGRLPGFNAASGDGHALVDRLRAMLPAIGSPGALLIHAAGCGAPERAARLAAHLAPLFPASSITVESDLLGAARSVWGRAPGLVLIAGTGMNAGRYDGHQLVAGLPSLGYVLGDEGSGADLGRVLLRDALRDRMPTRVRDVVFGGALELAGVIEQVYRRPGAAAALAAPVERLHDVMDEPYVQDLLMERFGALAAEVHRALGTGEVRAVGSVAAGFQVALGAALAGHGLQLTASVADPLPGLISYVRSMPL